MVYIDKKNNGFYIGEKLKIFITINVDKHSAPFLNSTKESLDDVLILHTEDSKDHFIAINGRWIFSSFGNDLSVLSRLRKPIREVTEDEIKTLVKTSTTDNANGVGTTNSNNNEEGDGDKVLSVPKELWRMVDFIYKNGMGVVKYFGCS